MNMSPRAILVPRKSVHVGLYRCYGPCFGGIPFPSLGYYRGA